MLIIDIFKYILKDHIYKLLFWCIFYYFLYHLMDVSSDVIQTPFIDRRNPPVATT